MVGSEGGGGGEASRLMSKSLTPSTPRKVSGVDTSSSLLECGGSESAVVLRIFASSAALWLVREAATVAFARLVGCIPVTLRTLAPAAVDTAALAGFAVGACSPGAAAATAANERAAVAPAVVSAGDGGVAPVAGGGGGGGFD